MNPKVSIVMGIYNCEHLLSDTIQSILNQTNPNWELIMCDDDSDDGTFEIAAAYSCEYSQIKLIKNQENRGLAYSLNRCIEVSSAPYIMRHDGDDLMMEDRIEKQLSYMREHNCDACGSGAYLFDEQGVWGIRQPEESPDKSCMITDTPFIHPTVLMKKSSLLKVGGYTDSIVTKQRLEDYELWLKFYENGYKLRNIQESLIYFREDQQSYKRKLKRYRITETITRLQACKRLSIPYAKRLFALKPVIMLFIPAKFLQIYHVRSARKKIKQAGHLIGK